MNEIMWLTCSVDGLWEVSTSEEMRKLIADGLKKIPVWRLIKGNQPESMYIDEFGTVRDIFGNYQEI